MPEPPALDPTKVGEQPMIFVTNDGVVSLGGEPGATAPRTTVRITNLDDTAAPIETRAGADGSFQVTLEVPLGDELRLQPILGGERGAPLDLLRATDGTFVPSPRHDCFRIESGLELEFAGVRGGSVETEAVQLENGCDQEASVDSSGTRLGLTAFALGTNLPIVVPPQSSATVLVERDSTVTDEQEDVLFLTVNIDGVGRRYPITLFAPAR